MSRSTRIVLALLPVLCAGACNSDMQKVQRIADTLCACKDLQCATNVANTANDEVSNEVFERLMKENPKEGQEVMTRIMVCITELPNTSNLPAEMPFLPNQEIPDFSSTKP